MRGIRHTIYAVCLAFYCNESGYDREYNGWAYRLRSNPSSSFCSQLTVHPHQPSIVGLLNVSGARDIPTLGVEWVIEQVLGKY
jgi:hypothetical protein